MSLLDRFRKQPDWKHPDPSVRADAVRKLSTEERAVADDLARSDPDAQVRRVAVRKLMDVATLVAIVRDETDGGVRDAASETLLQLALGTADAERAAAAVDDPRHLLTLAREAALPAVRRGAVARMASGRSLLTLARGADDADVRRDALARVADAAGLAEVALKSEHKDTALLATERLTAPALLETVAARARSKHAARRARAMLDAMAPSVSSADAAAPAPVAAPVEDDSAEMARYEALRAEQERERAEQERESSRHAEEQAERRRLETGAEREERRVRMESVCAEMEALADVADLAEAERAAADVRKRWEDLAPETGDALQERFADAIAKLQGRRTAEREAAKAREKAQVDRLRSLCEEVERLGAAAEPALGQCQKALREAKAALDQPAGAGKAEGEALRGRLKAARGALYTRFQELRTSEDWKRWANIGVQEELSRQMEALAEEKDLPRAAKAMRELEEKWTQARQAPRGEGEALWQRFKTARDAVRTRTAAHFQEEGRRRAEHLAKKTALVAEAESLAESSEWAKSAERFRAMQEEWKTTGPVPRQKSEALWNRFRAAGNRFFARQKEDRTRRSKERAQNLDQKDALCARAEALAESTDWTAAAAEVKKLQVEWRTIGPVPKARSDAQWQRFRTACDRFFERFKQRDAVDAAARLVARAAVCETLESLTTADPQPSAEAAAEAVRAAQAEWKSAPHVSGAEAEGLQSRFAAALHRVAAAHPSAFRNSDLDLEANRRKLEALLSTVEGLAPVAAAPRAATPVARLAEELKEALAANTMGAKSDESARRRETKDRVEAAQAAWARVGPVSADDAQRLGERFREACRRALGGS